MYGSYKRKIAASVAMRVMRQTPYYTERIQFLFIKRVFSDG